MVNGSLRNPTGIMFSPEHGDAHAQVACMAPVIERVAPSLLQWMRISMLVACDYT